MAIFVETGGIKLELHYSGLHLCMIKISDFKKEMNDNENTTNQNVWDE